MPHYEHKKLFGSNLIHACVILMLKIFNFVNQNKLNVNKTKDTPFTIT